MTTLQQDPSPCARMRVGIQRLAGMQRFVDFEDEVIAETGIGG